jgi:signal transduction histidine kinase
MRLSRNDGRFLIAFLAILFSLNTFGENPINVIKTNTISTPLNLNNYTYIYATKDTNSNLSSVIDKHFKYTPKGLKGINSNTIYWEKYSISNPTNDTVYYYIYFPYSVINKVIAYSNHQSEIKKIASEGMLFNSKNRVVEAIGYPIQIKLKPGLTNIYIYIKTFNLSLRTASFLLTEKQLLKTNTYHEKLIWFWKGFFFFATLIALILFIGTRFKMFLYYFLLNLGMGLFFTAELGEISNYINSIPFNLTANMKQTGILTAFIFFPLLINQITPIAKINPRLWKLLYFIISIIAISWLGCFIPYLMNSRFLLFTTYIYNWFAPFMLFFILYLIFIAYKQNTKNAKWLFIGYSGYILAIFIYAILPNLGFLTHNIHVYNTFIYGSLFEILMFMVLIGKETLSMYQHRTLLLEKQKSHQAEIIKAIVESQEKERNRVGRDIHDNIGANLSVIKQNIDKKNTVLLDTLSRTINHVRNLSHGLVTPLIKKDDFKDEISDLCFMFSDMDLSIKSSFYNWSEIKDAEKATHVYRIIQELLQNAVKHSGADNVLIQFIVNKNELTIMYEDDGKGFNYEAAYRGDGLGLINIENRIKIIEANIIFDTMLNGNGTTIIINVPI